MGKKADVEGKKLSKVKEEEEEEKKTEASSKCRKCGNALSPFGKVVQLRGHAKMGRACGSCGAIYARHEA